MSLSNKDLTIPSKELDLEIDNYVKKIGETCVEKLKNSKNSYIYQELKTEFEPLKKSESVRLVLFKIISYFKNKDYIFGITDKIGKSGTWYIKLSLNIDETKQIEQWKEINNIVLKDSESNLNSEFAKLISENNNNNNHESDNNENNNIGNIINKIIENDTDFNFDDDTDLKLSTKPEQKNNTNTLADTAAITTPATEETKKPLIIKKQIVKNKKN